MLHVHVVNVKITNIEARMRCSLQDIPGTRECPQYDQQSFH